MPNKQLTAKVRVDASNAHRALDKLITKMKQVENIANKQANIRGLEKSVEKALLQQEKLKQATAKTAFEQERAATQAIKSAEAKAREAIAQERLAVQISKSAEAEAKAQLATTKHQIAQEKLNTLKKKTESSSQNVVTSTQKWLKNVKGVLTKLNPINSIFGSISSIVTRIAGAIFSLGTIKLAIQGADILTGAENRLNNIAAKQLGSSAYTKDGQGNITGYSAEALNYTTEAMDKMYAAAKRARTSYSDMMANVSKTMTLAGDAFKGNIDNAIRFQEVMAKAYTVGGASAAEMSTSMYQLTQALGSGTLQGDELRSVREGAPLAYQAIEKFAQGVLNTEESLKDLASQGKITSEMVVAAIMDMGSEVDQAFALTKWRFSEVWESIKSSAQRAFQPVVSYLTEVLNQAVNNGLIEKFEQIFSSLAKVAMVTINAIANGMKLIAENWETVKNVLIPTLLIITACFIALKVATFAVFIAQNLWLVAFALVIYFIYQVIESSNNLYEAIITILTYIAQAILLTLTIITIAMMAGASIAISIPMLILMIVIGVLAALLAAFLKWTGQIVGFAYGLKEAIGAIFTNIKLAWDNILQSMQYLFWKFIDRIMQDFEPFIEIINKVLEAMDKKTIDVDFAAKKADALAEEIGFVDVGDAFSSGYSKGYGVGEGIQNKLKSFDGFSGGNLINNLGEKLGLDLSGVGVTPNSNSGLNTDDYSKYLDDIAGNTGKMADSMELSEEDLEYLRRVADMEWKKEFTTHEIKLDVTNNNSINSELDIFGIANKLTEVLYEEADYIPNGVYVG